MPTRRAWTLCLLALILYFLANQTQVGWIYIFSDSLIGLLIVAFFYSQGMLNTIQVQRVFTGGTATGAAQTPPTSTPVVMPPDNLDLPELPPFHEDDPILVTLRFTYTHWRPALQISGNETCPLAPVEEQAQPFFIPGLFKGQVASLTYQTVCDRRGLYTFGPIALRSRGPFGLFHTRRTLAAPGEILIYPAYHPLKRIRALTQKELGDRQALRLGVSSEVIGTREYRPGDSLRQIHWRSTARAGKLVVKEFADEEQQALTVVLDLTLGSHVGAGKYSTFETAVRIAASLGYYATRQNIPFYLAGAGKKWTPPATSLSWWAILNYLAKVRNDGQEPLANVLSQLPPATFTVVLISRPGEAVAQALLKLARQNVHTLAIFITPDGLLPPTSPAKTATLEIKSVSPYNWAEVVATL